MAIVGLNELLRRVKEENLIEGLSTRELTNPEGCGFDLRIGEVHKITEGGAFIEADGSEDLGKRQGVKTQVLLTYDPNTSAQQNFIAEPRIYYLFKTIEKLNTPLDLVSDPQPRGSLMKSGILVLATKGAPGYKGQLAFGMINLSEFPVRIQMGARVMHILFHKVEGETSAYRGQHVGGRISFEEERQV